MSNKEPSGAVHIPLVDNAVPVIIHTLRGAFPDVSWHVEQTPGFEVSISSRYASGLRRWYLLFRERVLRLEPRRRFVDRPGFAIVGIRTIFGREMYAAQRICGPTDLTMDLIRKCGRMVVDALDRAEKQRVVQAGEAESWPPSGGQLRSAGDA